MLTLPKEIIQVIRPFAQAFSYRIWDLVQVLVIGAILTPGPRTVCAVLRTMGLSQETQYQNYHRVMNRAVWSGLTVSKILLGVLVTTFVGTGTPIIVGTDETLERRKGEKIKAKGVFRDPVRSSKKYTVHAYGLRWISMMLIVPVPWSQRVWALPFLTVLAPSENTNRKNGKRHKTSIDWIMQMISVVYRCYRHHQIVLVTDGGLTAVKLGLHCQGFAMPVTYVSRLRLDAALYAAPGPQPEGKPGPKPKKGGRQPALAVRAVDPQTKWEAIDIAWYGGKLKTIEIATDTHLWYTAGVDPMPMRWVLVRDPAGQFETTAFLCTDTEAEPTQILNWFIMRWSLEVTFQEARSHLGLETQRQWSDLAVARTTPALLGLFSLITLMALTLTDSQPLPLRTAAWYHKPEPTFSDTIAFVRHFLWSHMQFHTSPAKTTLGLIPDAVLRTLIDSICYSA